MSIKAIETDYNGYKFRSRLEARWARILDLLRIKWRYEDEGYETPYGYYLPDFYLPDTYLRSEKMNGVLLEIKNEFYDDDFHPQLEFVAGNVGVGGILAKGIGLDYDKWRYLDWGETLIQVSPPWDAPMMLYVCVSCGASKFDYNGSSYYFCPKCGHEQAPSYTHAWVHAAVVNAQKYRFW